MDAMKSDMTDTWHGDYENAMYWTRGTGAVKVQRMYYVTGRV
jgi:hypothetical protein